MGHEARNDIKNEVYLHLKIEKALRAAKEENKELLSKLIAKQRDRRSAEAGLKMPKLKLRTSASCFIRLR